MSQLDHDPADHGRGCSCYSCYLGRAKRAYDPNATPTRAAWWLIIWLALTFVLLGGAFQYAKHHPLHVAQHRLVPALDRD